MKTEDMIMMPIPIGMYTAVCALLGGSAILAAGAPQSGNRNVGPGVGSTGADQSDAAEQSGSAAEASPAAATDVGSNAPAGDVEIDAHGHPWNPDMHASTKGKTKDGLWRMKVGVSRPDPLPGFPKDSPEQGSDTGTSTATPTPSATSQTATAPATAPAATSSPEEEDEFAAFRAAAATSDATDAAAAAAAPTVRQWSDADLGSLCNQAAVKLGDPAPIKEIIAQYVPQGEVAHSRNIPPEKREDFAKAVEAKAGIEFAG